MSSRRKRNDDTKSNRSVAFSEQKTPIKRQATNISSQTRLSKGNTLKNGMVNAENFSQHVSNQAPEITQQVHEHMMRTQSISPRRSNNSGALLGVVGDTRSNASISGAKPKEYSAGRQATGQYTPQEI